MPDWFSSLTIIGLSYDLIGVILLAVGMFWKPIKVISQESSTYWGANQYQMKAIVRGQIDTIAGLMLLVPGFFLQILGVNKVVLYEICIWGLWIFEFVMVAAYIFGVRNWVAIIRDGQVEKLLKEQEKN